MPPPSCANSATKLAPKAKPTMRKGACSTVTSPTNTWNSVNTSHTPSSDRDTTRNPETAPPRMATWTASTRLRRAADAVRTLARTLTCIPMMPESIEQPAPTRNAKAVRTPIGRPAMVGTSATAGVSTKAMIAPMMTAATRASSPIVVYWRLTNASAPSRIVAATSTIACVPVSRDSTSRARYIANRIAVTPAIGMIQ